MEVGKIILSAEGNYNLSKENESLHNMCNIPAQKIRLFFFKKKRINTSSTPFAVGTSMYSEVNLHVITYKLLTQANTKGGTYHTMYMHFQYELLSATAVGWVDPSSIIFHNSLCFTVKNFW